MIIDTESGKEMFNAVAAVGDQSNDVDKREQLRNQAMKFLYDNQECFVAQWILQNPYANIGQYALKFVYNDSSLLGYSVTMEKIDV
jgi:hypothetical protein